MARRRSSERSYKVQMINIKLLSNNRSGNNAYTDIISQIKDNKISISVHGDTHMILRTQFSDIVKIGDNNYNILYGKIAKYTVINGNDWLNMNNMEVEAVELPEGRFPNLKEAEYVFIPAAHRLAILQTSDQNIGSIGLIYKFLLGAVKAVIGQDEDFEICIEQSEDVFERIINAEAIKKLFIDISYSNADTGEEAFAFMDAQIRESEMKRLKLEATPNHTGNIKTDSTLVKGALKVAQSNGYARATIVENGRRQIVVTKDHPKELLFRCEETAIRLNVVTRIIELFRR